MAALPRRALEGDGKLGILENIFDDDCHGGETRAVTGDGACADPSSLCEQDSLTHCALVILSAAKDLAAEHLVSAAKHLVERRGRFFASLRMTRYPYPERGT